jgi:glucokinase
MEEDPTMILAGDVGGTHVRLAAFDMERNRLNRVVENIYDTADYKTFSDAMMHFVKTEGIVVDRACIGVAGPVRRGRAKFSNLDWVIDARELAQQLRIPSVGLINDLEAFAYGISTCDSCDFVTLQEGAEDATGNTAVISAGTGLGVAALYWDGMRHHPFATEGGHADFAPRNDLELELARYLIKRYQHVSWERILSGPGIRNVYEFLRDTKVAEEPAWLSEQIKQAEDVPALISKSALEHRAPICEQAMELFVSIYGAEAGNCALRFMALGGMYIGGSIAAKILPLIKEPVFLNSFRSKGRMQALLEEMPLKIVLNDDAGILGAAHYTLVQKAFGREVVGKT